MKKFLLLVSVMICCAFLFVACEDKQFDLETDYNAEYLDYYPLNDGTLAVGVGNAVFLSEITVPSFYKGKTVTQIVEHGFKDCVNLKSIVIPNSIISIGDSAFSGCYNLSNIILPDSLISIGDSAFSGCSTLSNIILPDSLISIGSVAFSGCGSLTNISIGNSVTSIGYRAFDGCNNLVYNEYDNANYLGNTNNPHHALIRVKDNNIISCNIHDNTKMIYSSAFSGCASLSSIIIPDNVISIGNNAFSQCFSLVNISIGMGVVKIEMSAFRDCDRLVYNEYDNAVYLGNNINPYHALINAKDTSIANCNIHNDTKTIADSAFEDCDLLASVSIGDDVINIGNYAFDSCYSLSSVTIPDNVTSIGNYAFANCQSLDSVVISNSVTIIGESAFYNCSILLNVYYKGTHTQWEDICISSVNNNLLKKTNIYFYSESEPTEDGNYWHYIEGQVVKWNYYVVVN